jgi:hypothetical protein
MGAKHAKWFVISTKTTGWLRETELVPKTQGIKAAIQQTGFAIGLARKGKVPLPVPPHVAKDVPQARALHDIVNSQDRTGALGIVQGERALSRLEHGHAGANAERGPYGEGSFPRPFLPDEKPAGGDQGMGSRTQADVTPGAEPTRKPGGGA